MAADGTDGDGAGNTRFERVRRLIGEDRLTDAAEELERVAVDLAMDEIREGTVLTRRDVATVERRLRENLISFNEADPRRSAAAKRLYGLTDAAQRAAARISEKGRGSARKSAAPPATAASSEAGAHLAARCQGVVKRYGQQFTMGPVSFELGHGEILAVAGANACGKTSLLRILAGALAPDEGERWVSPKHASGHALDVPLMRVPEAPPAWSGRLEDHLSWQAAFFGHRTRAENDRQVNHVLEQLGIEEHRGKRWDQLSEGIRMRAAIAVVMLANPGIVVLDEPLGPLDPLSQQDLLRWMRNYARGDRRTSFVLAAHHVPDVEAVADKVLLLVPGRPCAAVAPARAEAPAMTHFRLWLLPGADVEGIREKVSALGEDAFCEARASYLLVRVEPAVGRKLAERAAELAAKGVGAVQDVSRSAIRALLWGEETKG